MTIKTKLMLNAGIVILAVAAVSISSFIGMNSIQGKLSYLTEKSTPYQVRRPATSRSSRRQRVKRKNRWRRCNRARRSSKRSRVKSSRLRPHSQR